MDSKEFHKWRGRVVAKLPDLAARVFALRGKAYPGHGFHYYMEARLGRVISGVTDPTRMPLGTQERIAERLILQIVVEELFRDLAAAEAA